MSECIVPHLYLLLATFGLWNVPHLWNFPRFFILTVSLILTFFRPHCVYKVYHLVNSPTSHRHSFLSLIWLLYDLLSLNWHLYDLLSLNWHLYELSFTWHLDDLLLNWHLSTVIDLTSMWPPVIDLTFLWPPIFDLTFLSPTVALSIESIFICVTYLCVI